MGFWKLIPTLSDISPSTGPHFLILFQTVLLIGDQILKSMSLWRPQTKIRKIWNWSDKYFNKKSLKVYIIYESSFLKPKNISIFKVQIVTAIQILTICREKYSIIWGKYYTKIAKHYIYHSLYWNLPNRYLLKISEEKS